MRRVSRNKICKAVLKEHISPPDTLNVVIVGREEQGYDVKRRVCVSGIFAISFRYIPINWKSKFATMLGEQAPSSLACPALGREAPRPLFVLPLLYALIELEVDWREARPTKSGFDHESFHPWTVASGNYSYDSNKCRQWGARGDSRAAGALLHAAGLAT